MASTHSQIMQGSLTNVFIAFLWFIAAFSLCVANSCYSYAQYRCQREVNAMIEARDHRDNNEFNCGNFTKASLCITRKLHICIKNGGLDDSRTFYTDIVKHHTQPPYNCKRVVYVTSSASSLQTLGRRPWLILLPLTFYLTNNLSSQM